MSAAVAIALHTFHVTRAFQAWQTANNQLDHLSEAANVFLVGTKLHSSLADCARKAHLQQENYKNSRDDISGKQSSHSTSTKHPKFKTLCTAEENVSSGEGLDREKDPRSRPGSYCFVGCMWIVTCDGRWWADSLLQASSGLFGQIGTLRH